MGIIKKVKEASKDNSALIFGLDSSGKSYQAIQNTILGGYVRVLYIAFGASAIQFHDVPDTWDTAQILDWNDFTKEIVTPAKKGELGYDCIILDDYNNALEYLAPTTDTPSRQQYGQMAVKFSTPLNALKAACECLVVTLSVIDHKDDGRKVDLTPRSFRNVVGKFTHRHYTYVVKGKKGGLEYGVQCNPKLALNFTIDK